MKCRSTISLSGGGWCAPLRGSGMLALNECYVNDIRQINVLVRASGVRDFCSLGH